MKSVSSEMTAITKLVSTGFSTVPIASVAGTSPFYNNIPVQQGHSYSIVVAFNVTSYSAVLGPMGMTHSWSCYQADPVCDQTPPDMFDTGFCSQGVQVSQGKCFAFEWSSTDYNVTAI